MPRPEDDPDQRRAIAEEERLQDRVDNSGDHYRLDTTGSDGFVPSSMASVAPGRRTVGSSRRRANTSSARRTVPASESMVLRILNGPSELPDEQPLDPLEAKRRLDELRVVLASKAVEESVKAHPSSGQIAPDS